ncbi:MAG: heavy metal-associated domain-containing protein [Candidatus Magasanikbacteria bacterium]|jgi:copper chaperone CopZ
MYKLNFKITNLDCEACIKLSTSALKTLSSVQTVKIDLKSGLAEVESNQELNWEDVKKSLAEVSKNAEK